MVGKGRKKSNTLIIKIVSCNNECFTTAQVQQSCVQKPQVCSVGSFPAVNAA